MFKKIVLGFMILTLSLWANNLKIAVGAGYKQPLMEVIKAYEKNGKKVEAIFGNMKQVSTQATQTNMALIIGDKSFLALKSNLKFKEFVTLGKGKVVIAFPKGKEIKEVEDLLKPTVKRVSMPQPQKAIYGIAGEEFLKNANLYEGVKGKLLEVATVPQAMTYVVANEVDAAIVNLTAALANKNNIGGYILVSEEFYNPIEIVAGKLEECKDKECEEFMEFLVSPLSKEIFKQYGL
ncbi:MAG: molybdate ABC transporter substrate-binding protein [Arcobacteraceae bacterium]